LKFHRSCSRLPTRSSSEARDFITLLGGAAAWPLAAGAQQPGQPVIGFLHGASPGPYARFLPAFHQGLKETGYTEGGNVAVEYRWAEDRYDRLPALAADLVDRHVTVIAAAGSTPAALAAKAATTTIPIVFLVGVDPVAIGLVASLARPGGNLTGVVNLTVEVGPKRLEMLHAAVPTATTIALLVNPTASAISEPYSQELQVAAGGLGLQLHVLNASTEQEIDAAFATLVQLRAGGLVIGPDTLFISRAEQLAELALRYRVPAIFQYHDFTTAGGLMSYGSDLRELLRLGGLYTGRILKGEKPADLPVQQATKVELIINLKTANALGLTMPTALLVRADEVIE
jgi:putative tryptophan/tyrosine transport system substrate-binding protein